MTKGILIPADWQQPVQVIELHELADFQQAVGGNIEPVDLPNHYYASLFVNEEGKLRGLNTNERATLLWWIDSPWVRGHDFINGDVVAVGMADDDGETKDIPPTLHRHIMERRAYRISYRESGTEWREIPTTFVDYFAALAFIIKNRNRDRLEGVEIKLRAVH